MTDMAVVQSHCFTCWPCSTISDPESNDLKDRVCPHWRMIPGIFCLVSNIIAVVCALIWQTHSLCIAFVPAGACSSYLIYLGWDFQHLQTFAESNDKLKGSLATLRGENENLQATNQRLTTQLGQLDTTLEGLTTENGTLKSSNLQLTASVDSLKTSLLALEQMNNTLKIRMEAETAQLNILHKSLSSIQASAKQDHSTFAEQLAMFIQQVELLQKTRAQFEGLGSQVQAQSTMVVESAHMLKEIFSQISAWKDGEEVKRRLTLSQQLAQQVLALQDQLGTQKGQLEMQARQIEEMQKIQDGFTGLLEKLLAVAAQLEHHNGDLAQEIVKAAQAFEKYEISN